MFKALFERKRRLAAICLGLVVGSSLLGGFIGSRVLAGGDQVSQNLRTYTAIVSAIQGQYFEEVKPELFVTSSIREMLRSLDPHSTLYEVRAYAQLQERQKGTYYGLGITVQSVDGNITVVAPFEGTPAHRLGIRAGDIISRISGEDARGLTIDEAVKKLKGPKGSSVDITVVREGYDTPLEFSVIRDEVRLHAVPYYFMAGSKTGYIRLTDFNELTACRPGEGSGCERELETALRSLKEDGATSIVLDIRDNPGGLLDQAFAVSNLFLKKGQMVVFTKGRTKRDESNYITEQDSPFADLPLVVVTSRHTASASEIVAGAIQDHDRGLIVGETTFGKGLVQTVMPLRNVRGYGLALTTARYYTPSGRSIQRDYGNTSYEDYVSPRDRKACDVGDSDAKLTDAGRKVLGGDGITPDYCVEPETLSKFVSNLVSRGVFRDVSSHYVVKDGNSTQIAGAGSRSKVESARITAIAKEWEVDDAAFRDLEEVLKKRQIAFEPADIEQNREALRRQMLYEVLLQTYGEGLARERTLAFDPQVQKAVSLVSKAALLLKDPKQYIAQDTTSTVALR